MKKFSKRVENFVCEVCGTKVKGNGFTDHCPNCLWSKHVDINPGDRSAECDGLMEPVGITQGKEDKLRIVYRCQKCGYQRVNNAVPEDNLERIIQLSTNLI